MPRLLPGFVGRSGELAELRRALASLRAIVIVDGEAGIGKSRLVAEALSDWPGARQLIGACEPVQEPFPLGPVLDAVRGHASRLPPAGRLDPVVGALAPYLPELANALPPAPPPLPDRPAERHRLFRAVVALLDDLGPTVLVLEDVHWADAGTCEFVAYLAARMPDRLGVVLTLRTGTGSELPIWEAVTRSTRITLEPLPPSQVGELARQLLDSPELPDRFVASLVEATAGIPFVIEEVLRARPDIDAGLPVPTALRDLLLARWTGLDDETREVLSAAAVLGATPDEELLGRLAGPPERVARALTRGLAVGLLHEQDGQCRFRHALAWQVIHEALPPPTRRWLHLQAAQLLEDGPEPKPVARLAHHYRQAGATSQFVRSAEAAADLAVSHGDDATAARFLVPAVQAPGLPTADRVRLAGKLARAAVDGLAQAAAVPVLTGLLSSGRSSDADELDAPTRGELRFMLGRLLRQQGEAEQGYREIERSVEDLGERPQLLARALAILAVPDIVVDRPVAVHLARSAQASAAARDGEPAVAAAVDIARTSLAIELGDPAGWPLVEAVRRSPALLANPREHARACLNWAQAALHVGDLARAESLLTETRHVVDEVAYLRFAGVVELIDAWLDLAAGRWSGLEDRARALVREPSEFTAAALDARFLLGTVLALQGDTTEAAATLREVITVATRVGALRPLVPARAQLARLLLGIDQPRAAAYEAAAALDVARVKGLWACAADSVLCLVDALGRDAMPFVMDLATGLRGAAAPSAHARLAQCRAELTDHAALFSDAAERFATLGLPYEQADASARLGRCLARRGDPDAASALERALRGFDQLGARADLARVRRSMRDLGVPVPYPWRGGRQSYGPELSPREREVATLAASGTTNREIAERLFLSRRTVESHLANALRKLGGRSRRELPALLTDS